MKSHPGPCRRNGVRALRVAWILVLVGLIGCGGSAGPHEQTSRAPGWSHGRSESGYEFRRARVIDVLDGDSLRVRYEGGGTAEVRLRGIDCPETSTEVEKCWSKRDLVDIPCREQVVYGRRARRVAERQLLGKPVRLESYESFPRDDYGRLLAYLRLPDGTDYGEWMLRGGFCVHAGRRYDHPRRATYRQHPDLINRLHRGG